MMQTQHSSLRTKQLVYHDWFNTPLKELVTDAAIMTADSSENNVLKSVEMAYFGSIKSYKGKIFLLVISKRQKNVYLQKKECLISFHI